MRILIVRHGESRGNVDKSVHLTVADHAISLSAAGHEQAVRAGEAVAEYFRHLSFREPGRRHVRMWTSPYLRAEQTADGVAKGAGSLITDRRQDVCLVEQQFGLFDGVPDEDLPRLFPAEHAHYKKCEDFGGRFWARVPMGESRFDVAMRVKPFLGALRRDEEKHGISDVVVVTHGVTSRCLIMQACHKTVEWFEAEKNPKNASVRLVEDGQDRGYVFGGF